MISDRPEFLKDFYKDLAPRAAASRPALATLCSFHSCFGGAIAICLGACPALAQRLARRSHRARGWIQILALMIFHHLNDFQNYLQRQETISSGSTESLVHRGSSRCWISSAAAPRPELATQYFPNDKRVANVLHCFLSHGADLCMPFLFGSWLNFLISPSRANQEIEMIFPGLQTRRWRSPATSLPNNNKII